VYTESHSDLGIADELRDKEFRDQFFRTERELDIPAQIKALRKLRGHRQDQLAEMVGTKQSGISRLERSTNGNWNLETLVKISEALDARLSVVIEPVEVVIARYKAEDNARGNSAATAGLKGASDQSQSLADVPKEPDASTKQMPQPHKADGQSESALWN
jgi:transcriptional regulator with XRE-family HTH domain